MAVHAAVQATSQRSLPTLDRLQARLPENLDARSIAADWLQDFGSRIETGDAPSISDVLLEDAFWRDTLALTWDFRTFEGRDRIERALQDLLPSAGVSAFRLKEDSVGLQQPFPDLAWIQAMFDFETCRGTGSGVFRIALPVDKALEGIYWFPERVGTNRDFEPNHGKWPEKRRWETEFKDREPTVVVVGGGHSGLDIAARLKLLGVSVLILEKNLRVGDQWRGRYEALCLHDPVWYDHLPYIPFPSSWPVWTPAPKLADWLESYARNMELDIWTGTSAERLEQLVNDQGWIVTARLSDGSRRTLKPRHVILATGFGGGAANVPSIPGMDQFEGKMLHSFEYKTARDHIGKKVVVIGAATSGHDVAQDHYNHGVDVTIYQRSSTYIMTTKKGSPIQFAGLYWEGGPPTEIADRLAQSFPVNALRLIHQRVTKQIAQEDAGILSGLEKRGFRTNFGLDGSGLVILAYDRGGGYYLDVGASQLIIDGKIKLKNDSKISHFSKNSIVFEDTSELPADVIIFATGIGDSRTLVKQLAGDEIAARVNDVWGLNEEGEIKSAWRWSGVPRLYFMMGNLALCRYYSKHLALLIKAQEEGIIGETYTK